MQEDTHTDIKEIKEEGLSQNVQVINNPHFYSPMPGKKAFCNLTDVLYTTDALPSLLLINNFKLSEVTYSLPKDRSYIYSSSALFIRYVFQNCYFYQTFLEYRSYRSYSYKIYFVMIKGKSNNTMKYIY